MLLSREVRGPGSLLTALLLAPGRVPTVSLHLSGIAVSLLKDPHPLPHLQNYCFYPVSQRERLNYHFFDHSLPEIYFPLAFAHLQL